ncbi:hypothetical protein [Streptomyces mangrovisoli]|uniref:Secreted protein n=1 Tax=Streptomyces mangrovisoli TaxID=1428628 RepID=A0A1J4P2M0_9ACTN|nr:hypothetical protein [Streptomyces mangrovisoli]OIJ68867.1 hypothetical protein WN71_005230 [Streptomyces mangrovisoli]
MISPRRIVAAVGLAVGVTGLAAPLAQAAPQASGQLNPVSTLDSIAASGIPAEEQGRLPHLRDELAALNGVNGLSELGQLHQVTDLAAPVTGLLPGIEA